MKLSLIAVCMFALVGCASGEGDPVDTTVPVEAPKPEAPSAPVVDDVEPEGHCKVDIHRVNNCFVKVTVCDGEISRIDISCDRGRELWPWEYIPDPPHEIRNTQDRF